MTDQTFLNKQVTLPDLLLDLASQLAETNHEVVYEFDELELLIPARATEQPYSRWRLNGTLTVRARAQTPGDSGDAGDEAGA